MANWKKHTKKRNMNPLSSKENGFDLISLHQVSIMIENEKSCRFMHEDALLYSIRESEAASAHEVCI